MGLIIKLLKLRIIKVFFFLLMVAFFASIYFYQEFYIRQYHKCVAFYYVHMGDKAFKKQKYQKAIDNYKIALNYYPEHSRASCNLGNIYVSFENFQDAIVAYENALKYSPEYSVCRMDMGIILAERMADYDRAIQEYHKITIDEPVIIHIPYVFSNKEATLKNKGLAYYNMGLAYRRKAVYMGDRRVTATKYLKKARESYIKAKEYLKNDYDNTYNLALTNHLLGDYTSAAAEYCNAININPAEFEAHYNLALMLRAMNMNKESLDEFEKATLLLDLHQMRDKNKYVNGIINEVRRRIINDKNYDYLKNRVDLTALDQKDIVYSNGKIIGKNQKDYDVNTFMKCTLQDKFKEI